MGNERIFFVVISTVSLNMNLIANTCHAYWNTQIMVGDCFPMIYYKLQNNKMIFSNPHSEKCKMVENAFSFLVEKVYYSLPD